MDERGAVRAVIGLADDDERRSSVVEAIEAAGGEVVGHATMGRLLLALTDVARPALVVVDPGIGGPLGKRLVPRLLEVAPTAAIVALGPLVVPGSVSLDRVRVVEGDVATAVGALVDELSLLAELAAPARDREHQPA